MTAWREEAYACGAASGATAVALSHDRYTFVMDDIYRKFELLEEKIRGLRTYGEVRAGIHKLKEEELKELAKLFSQNKELEYVSEYMRSEGFSPSEQWTLLNEYLAVEILTYLITKDLAYGQTMNDVEDAKELAQTFINLFEADKSIFLSNNLIYKGLKTGDETGAAWHGLTDATFDSGLIGFDDKIVAYFWFEDED